MIDGCPPGVKLSEKDIQPELERRRPGQSHLTTSRQETDLVEIVSGVFEGKTLGTPITMLVRNKDARVSEYKKIRDTYRPSHADYTYDAKYGLRNWSGGGRSSARETVGRVAAGAVAKKILRQDFRIEIFAWVHQVYNVVATVDPAKVTLRKVEANLVRCPDPKAAKAMIALIEQARSDGDSLGGIVGCTARRVPVGWGEPVFDKLEGDLAKAMLSIPATRAFALGSGFEGVTLKGSEHNDPYFMSGKEVKTTTNHSGGIQGGISNGEDINFEVALKPTATIRKKQKTVNRQGKNTTIEARGRHDPCVLPRAVPIVEAMAALVLMDHYLRHRGQTGESAGASMPQRRGRGRRK